MTRDAVPLIKQTLTAKDVAVALGLKVDRNDRCPCLWHNDRHPSMKLYPGDRGCYCFACHQGGDVIDMTMQALNVPLKDAVAWLNEAFHLGLDNGPADGETAMKAAKSAADRRRRAREAKTAMRNHILDLQHDADALARIVDEAIKAERPRRYSDGFSDRFTAALMAREELAEINTDLAVLLMREQETRT